MKKILFISHDASRTGAPIVLLHLMRWIKQNSPIEFSILLKAGGELENEFRQIAQVHLWEAGTTVPAFTDRLINAGKRRLFGTNRRQEKIVSALVAGAYDIIYSNTVASHSLAVLIKGELKIPLISHIHELPYCINVFYAEQMSDAIKKDLDGVIAVSEITAKYLREIYEIPAEKIKLYYEFVPVRHPSKISLAVEEVKEMLSVKDRFIVGGSGAMSWRKGIDLFISLSWLLAKKRPEANISFVWVGAISRDVTEGYKYECARLGVEETIIFTGVQAMPQNYFQVLDLFALTSREDPFPLVCLEAASLGKPVLCFENAGGIPEMIARGGGVILPYHDVEAMADSILELYDNPQLLADMGVAIKAVIENFDVNKIAPAIIDYVMQFKRN